MLVAFSPKHRHTYTNRYTHKDTYICPHIFFLDKMTAKFYFPMFSVSNSELFFSVLLLIPYEQWCIEMQLSRQPFHKLKASPYHTNCWDPAQQTDGDPRFIFFFFSDSSDLKNPFQHGEESLVSLIKVGSQLFSVFKIL